MGIPRRARRRAFRPRRRASWWTLPVVLALAAGGMGTAATMVSGVSLRPAPASTGAFGRIAQAAGLAVGDAPAPAADTGTPGNPDCTLIVPAHPLSAQGLATPYQLTATDPAKGSCHERDPDQAAFVSGAIIDLATGRISVYNPLVIDRGSRPAIHPRLPALPARRVVALWFGFNGNVLTLADTSRGATLTTHQCVNGLGVGLGLSPFGQMAYCNAPAFFAAARQAIAAGQLTVPSPGTGTDGLPCLTLRSFALVDQDQSDNVTAQYLITRRGRLAQDTAANRARLSRTKTTLLSNGSDNGLLTFILDPALGCRPWLAPNLADPGAQVPSLALDELQAARFAGQPASGPVALVPANDPMVLTGTAVSTGKLNLYRAGVDQAPAPAGPTPAEYCVDLEQIQPQRLQQDVNLLIGQPSPMPAGASNLFTFLASRLQQSFVNLGCTSYGIINQVTVTATGAGVVTAACFAHPVQPLTPGPGNPTAGQAICPATAAPGTPTPAQTATPAQTPALTPPATPTPAVSRSPVLGGPPSPRVTHSPLPAYSAPA
jgi:hypothetical protein